jgi:hypothetical protein
MIILKYRPDTIISSVSLSEFAYLRIIFTSKNFFFFFFLPFGYFIETKFLYNVFDY